MKKTITLCAVLSVLIGLALPGKAQIKIQSNDPLTGAWVEVMPTTTNDELDELDRFLIVEYENKYSISSLNYKYFSVSEVEYDGSKLTFTMLNNENRDEIYVLDYKCFWLEKGKKMNCSFVNQKGERIEDMVWEKYSKK